MEKEKEMKHSVLYYMVMTAAWLAILCSPFMPYVYSDLLAFYLDSDFLTAAGLVHEMYVLHTMPESVSIFGYEHYDMITTLLMVLGVAMIVLPVLLEGASLALLLWGKTEKVRKAGLFLSVAVIFLFLFYLIFFNVAGSFLGMSTRAGYGIDIALAASVAFTAAARAEAGKKLKRRGKGFV